MSTKIFWTSREQRFVATEARKAQAQDGNLSLLNAVRIAISSLPADRQRRLASLCLIPWIHTELREVDRLASLEPPVVEQPKAEVQAPGNDLLDQLLARLVTMLEPKIQIMIDQAVAKVAQNSVLSHAPSFPTEDLDNSATIKATPQRKPVLLMLNLLPIQFNSIQKEYGDRFELRLWSDKESSAKQLKDLCSTAHKVYGMTKFMSHSVDSMASKAAGHNYIRFTGGVSALKRTMESTLLNS